MKADALPIHGISDGERRFVAPHYHRPYVWERNPQRETFWDDVREIAERLLAGGMVSPFAVVPRRHLPRPGPASCFVSATGGYFES